MRGLRSIIIDPTENEGIMNFYEKNTLRVVNLVNMIGSKKGDQNQEYPQNETIPE